jgi:hypothetical protein
MRAPSAIQRASQPPVGWRKEQIRPTARLRVLWRSLTKCSLATISVVTGWRQNMGDPSERKVCHARHGREHTLLLRCEAQCDLAPFPRGELTRLLIY